MTDFITVPVVCGIFVFGIYKLFELFVCKKERLAIIEKIGDKLSPELLRDKIDLPSVGRVSFSSLKFGCLFLGVGLGLLVAYLICTTTLEGYATMSETRFNWNLQETIGVIYGACVLVFGGAGLLVSFLVELKIGKK